MTDTIQILHVEDDPAFADLTATYLRREADQFAVTSVRDPQAAQEHLGESPVDCIVSDHDMPGQTGIEFLRTVRDEFPDLPFILFTGKGSEEVASEAISAGVTDYLQKEMGTDQFKLLTNRLTTAVENYRTQHTLERQSDLFQRTQDLANVGAWEHDLVDGEVHFSDKIYDIYGVDPDYEPDPEGDIERFYHPDDREKVREATNRAVESGESYDIEVRITAADGTEKWIRTRGKPEFKNGTCQRVRGTFQDITDRKEREHDSELQRKRLTVALSGSNAGVWEWIPDTGEVICHESTERLLGLEPGTFDGTYESFAEFIHDEDISTLETAAEEARATKAPFEIEYRINTADDEELWVSSRGEFVDIEGLSPRYVGVLTDITESKQRALELEQTKEWYRTLLDTAPDAVLVADAESGELLETNQAATKLLGRSRDEILGMHQTEVHPPENSEAYAEQFDRHVAAGVDSVQLSGNQQDIYVTDASGERIPVEINARTIEVDGQHLNQGYFRDISERKERERELRQQKERLEEFASVVSHDLRNPLNVVSGRLELVREECDSEHFETIDGAIGRMERIIDDVLWLAHEGRDIGETRAVDLRQTAERLWAVVSDTSEGADLITEVTDNRGVIDADPDRLAQLLENIFRNAIDHGGSDVTVRLETIEDGFAIEDDGSGIAPDDREHVFKTGYSTDDGGTGLGLSIVKQVADAHGWDIHVTAGSEGGARFEITGVEFDR